LALIDGYVGRLATNADLKPGKASVIAFLGAAK